MDTEKKLNIFSKEDLEWVGCMHKIGSKELQRYMPSTNIGCMAIETGLFASRLYVHGPDDHMFSEDP